MWWFADRYTDFAAAAPAKSAKTSITAAAYAVILFVFRLLFPIYSYIYKFVYNIVRLCHIYEKFRAWKTLPHRFELTSCVNHHLCGVLILFTWLSMFLSFTPLVFCSCSASKLNISGSVHRQLDTLCYIKIFDYPHNGWNHIILLITPVRQNQMMSNDLVYVHVAKLSPRVCKREKITALGDPLSHIWFNLHCHDWRGGHIM